jgi:hypothetical protein
MTTPAIRQELPHRRRFERLVGDALQASRRDELTSAADALPDPLALWRGAARRWPT